MLKYFKVVINLIVFSKFNKIKSIIKFKVIMKEKQKEKKINISSSLISSIAISGLFLSLILILNFTFDLFKAFGGFSIQMFLVVYALGIYIIKNKLVNIFFFLSVPPILFALENGPYIKTAMQVLLEYFIVFYVFGLFFLCPYLNKIINKKDNKFLETLLITFFYIICITIKFILHSIASYVYWLESKSWTAALVFNAIGSLANSSLTIPFLIIATPTVLFVSNRFNGNVQNKY